MLLTLERNSGVPVFRQICDQIRFQVAAGVLASGDELPSTRDLAAQLQINPMTVSKAYGLLEQEGMVERRPGLALVVRTQPVRVRQNSGLTQLERLLQPAARAARQLDIPAAEALALFKKLLRSSAASDASVRDE